MTYSGGLFMWHRFAISETRKCWLLTKITTCNHIRLLFLLYFEILNIMEVFLHEDIIVYIFRPQLHGRTEEIYDQLIGPYNLFKHVIIE